MEAEIGRDDSLVNDDEGEISAGIEIAVELPCLNPLISCLLECEGRLESAVWLLLLCLSMSRVFGSSIESSDTLLIDWRLLAMQCEQTEGTYQCRVKFRVKVMQDSYVSRGIKFETTLSDALVVEASFFDILLILCSITDSWRK